MDIATVLHNLASSERAKSAARFFKTGPGQYGEGDVFIGISVPQLREVAKQFKHESLDEIKILLQSPIHEFRMTGLFILKFHYTRSKKDKVLQKQLLEFYLDCSTTAVNNWDLVDCSADMVGSYLLEISESEVIDLTLLIELAQSKNLWQQRIAIVATMPMIKAGFFNQHFLLQRFFSLINMTLYIRQ
jgi:3-methyladenine DNA glycosylase AlkD